MLDLVDAVSSVAALVGVLSLTAMLKMVNSIRETIVSARRLDAVGETALEKDELEELGSYLLETIGELRVIDLAANDHARLLFEDAISDVAEYVGSNDMLKEPEPGGVAVGQMEESWPNDWAREFGRGESWNALARMRRDVEIYLRSMAEERHPGTGGAAHGAAQLVRWLNAEGEIGEDVAGELLFAISVANRGVHGLEVDADETFRALSAAAWGISQLREP